VKIIDVQFRGIALPLNTLGSAFKKKFAISAHASNSDTLLQWLHSRQSGDAATAKHSPNVGKYDWKLAKTGQRQLLQLCTHGRGLGTSPTTGGDWRSPFPELLQDFAVHARALACARSVSSNS
jgi:hypothetical protein